MDNIMIKKTIEQVMKNMEKNVKELNNIKPIMDDMLSILKKEDIVMGDKLTTIYNDVNSDFKKGKSSDFSIQKLQEIIKNIKK